MYSVDDRTLFGVCSQLVSVTIGDAIWGLKDSRTNIQTHPIPILVRLPNLNLIDFALCFLPFFETAPGPFYMRSGEVDL
jgi:hypothetical protein